ncbi:uncharacterized protein LOC126842517 [Adelges cooleyi]|uniref:uncharacterized protein LOC126842517 n=1 Tax=Adelges cooleyi TaxID=133065 RepID=UPI00217F4DAC|nr:uncharacterized protein LOC126842517 [Adelges cooleyi]
MTDKTVLTNTIENATELTARIKTLNKIIVQIQNAESTADNSDELENLKNNLKDAEKQLAVALNELGSVLKIDLDDFKCKTTGQTSTSTRECIAVRQPSTEGKFDDTGESAYEHLAALGHLDSMDKEEISNEVIENVIGELKIKMKVAEKHNSKLRCKLDEENRKSFKMAKMLRNRTPFSKMKTGEVVFPGKKQMETKIDIMTNEIKRLRQEFYKLQMEHCRLELARNAMIAADCPEPPGDDDVHVKTDNILQLNVFSQKLQDNFYATLEEISKFRVMLDDTKNELSFNNKQLSNAKAEISEKSKELTAFKKLTEDPSSMIHVYNNELKDAKNRVEGLEKIIEMQKCEMEAKNEKYMEMLQRKELKKIQSNELCQERCKREVENEQQFDRVREYFDKRLESIKHFPIAFQAAKEQLFEQKELKKETDRKIECLNDLLKKIVCIVAVNVN